MPFMCSWALMPDYASCIKIERIRRRDKKQWSASFITQLAWRPTEKPRSSVLWTIKTGGAQAFLLQCAHQAPHVIRGPSANRGEGLPPHENRSPAVGHCCHCPDVGACCGFCRSTTSITLSIQWSPVTTDWWRGVYVRPVGCRSARGKWFCHASQNARGRVIPGTLG